MSIDEIIELFGKRSDDLVLQIGLNEKRNGLRLSFKERKGISCYDIELIATPEAVDRFIASKMVFWFKHNFKVVIEDEVKDYTDFSETRKYFMKRMLRDGCIIQHRFFEKES